MNINSEHLNQDILLLSNDYYIKLQESLKHDFIECLLDLNQINNNIKKKFIELQQLKKDFNKNNNISIIKFFFNSLSKSDLSKIIELETKYIDIIRRARKSAINDILFDEKYSLKNQLQECFKNKISAKNLQKILNKNLVASFSLTAHPTNPLNLNYTILGNEFDKLISEKKGINFHKLNNLIKEMILCPLKSIKKTPLDEMLESELAIKNIAIANQKIIKSWQKIINQSPYKNKIKLPKKICEIGLWSHGGDGDGNSNMTAKILQNGLRRIKKFKLNLKIDIRHDSKDIERCFFDVFNEYFKNKIINIKNLENILQDDELLKSLYNKINKNKKINSDLIARMLIINKNLSFIDKFIISNFSKIEHYLMVIILLKITNKNQILPKINIISLSESLDDLKNIAQIHEKLLTFKIYRNHLKNTKKIIAMIAKSDTVRVAGMAVKFYQDQASGKILLLREIAKQKYNLDVAVQIFNGGGNSLQRGGGKFYESSLVHVINGLQEYKNNNLLFEDFDASLSTIQGQQQQILFSCEKNAENSLEKIALVNLYSVLLVKKYLSDKIFRVNKYYDFYQHFSDISTTIYQEKYYENKLLNRLFFNANHLGVALANLSSRPLKRLTTLSNILAPFDYQKYKGDIENFNLFNTRAITLDRTIAHSGTFILFFLGTYEGLIDLVKKYGLIKIREMAKNCFQFHEFLINQIIVIYMVDIDFAWQSLLGKSRPNKDKIIKMANQFFQNNIKKASIFNQQEIAMSYIDNYIFNHAKILAKIIFGDDKFLNFETFNVNILLKKYLPNLAKQLENRKVDTIFTRYVQSILINKFNNSHELLLEDDLQNIYQLYVANNPSFNTPIQINYNLKLE